MTLQDLHDIIAESGFAHAEFCIEQADLSDEDRRELLGEWWRLYAEHAEGAREEAEEQRYLERIGREK
jgi:hypothetical protein